MGIGQAGVEVLQHMVKGHVLCLTLVPSTCWLKGVYVGRGSQMAVQGTTFQTLHAYGWVERADTDDTPPDRQDYIITRSGRFALMEEEACTDAAQRDEARRTDYREC